MHSDTRFDIVQTTAMVCQSIFTARVGLPATRTRYDQLGRVTARVDTLGNTTTTTYSPDGRTVFVRNPNTSTVTYSRNASGDTLSITGSAVTPEFYTYGISPDGTRWSRTVQGETASSPRFTKRYENLLGQTIREERSGFQDAVLATTHAYDSFGRLVSTTADYEPTVEYVYDVCGNRVSTTRSVVGRGDPTAPREWRKNETTASFGLFDGAIWFTQTNIVSCSDVTIAPLVSSSARHLTGLTTAAPARSRSVDIRGDVMENETLVDLSTVTSRQTLPCATNKPLAISRYGVSLMDVSVSAVTNTVAYDSLGRRIANTDGRGNTTHAEYNAVGQHSASIDALGNRTSFAYDQFGNLASVTDPLGNAVVYEYDLRGRKTYEGGATYPVRYTYDVFGNKTTMMTYRNESLGPDSGDVTTWLYDEASGAMTNKVYADGKGPTYSYTPEGKLSRRVWARGIVTDYTYDGWGNLTNTVYSDNTPTISITYDALGRQTGARDAAGVTTFAYNIFGSHTNETVIGVAGTNIIIRHWDNFGRDAGYALNGVRQTTLAYDPATGRLATMHASGSETPFTWNYLADSDLKSSLAYPNGLTASWQYDANNQLLQVCNAFPTNVISQYDYTYDAAGRRVACGKSGSAFAQNDTLSYGYNEKSELTNAVASVDSDYRYAYSFDDIGNRETSSERGTNSVYTANQLNQYTAVDDFTPQFDDDGNQTIIRTATGIWHVQYNGENRPIHWTNGDTVITMSYDRMGRRNTKNDLCFVYNGYLQIANFGYSASIVEPQVFIWDPMEPVATRPLAWSISTTQLVNSSIFYYVHDGSKNVSEVIKIDGGIAAHYEYAPFGSVVVQCGVSAPLNPWRFSCEYADDEAMILYYNFRHYNPSDGRWLGRDKIGHVGGKNLQAYCVNRPTGLCDMLGLYSSVGIETHQNILKHALDALIEEGVAPCLNDAGKRDHVLGALQDANAGMDRGPYAEDKNLFLHFNRMMNQSPQDAIVAYTNALAEWRTGIDVALNAGWSEDCRKALRLMGELTHMTQDYWGHGVSWGYELHPRLVMTGDPENPVIYDPGYPPDSEIGEATGSPDDPSMKPSSYAGPLGDSEHGPIYGREPGNRAPDGTGWKLPFFWDYSTGRLGKAVDYTKQDLRKYLGTWCEKCCRYLEAQPAPYYGPRLTMGEFFSAMDY